MTFKLAIIMPVFRDWYNAAEMCRNLHAVLSSRSNQEIFILLVDDGSPDGMAGWTPVRSGPDFGVTVLRLETNLGHQRAIGAGLCWIHEHLTCDAVLIMDADGEDRPVDTLTLLEIYLRESKVCFAERRKRMESGTFQAGYLLYRFLHLALTGVAVRVGNFSILPATAIGRLVRMPELWNHYAGAVFLSRLPFDSTGIDRGTRFSGESKMNLVSLVAHGLAGISTFSTTVATRLLIGSSLLVLAYSCLFAIFIWLQFISGQSLSSWLLWASSIVTLFCAQMLAVSFSLAFTLIAMRRQAVLVPIQQYAVFVGDIKVVAGSNWTHRISISTLAQNSTFSPTQPHGSVTGRVVSFSG